MSVLLLGPTNSGKSTLLKILAAFKINESREFNELPVTIPTVGTNILAVNIGKKKVIELRELGGTMAPIWSSYYSQADGVIFLVDVSNTQQIATSFAFLQDIVAASKTEKFPILVVFNKLDIPSKTSINEYRQLMQLHKTIETAQSISYIDVSCKDKTGIVDVHKWICNLKTIKT